MVGITCLASSPKHTEIYNKILQEWPVQSAAERLTVAQVTEWIGSWQKSNNKNPEDLPTAKELVNYIDSDRVLSGKTRFSDLGIELVASDNIDVVQMSINTGTSSSSDRNISIINQTIDHLKSISGATEAQVFTSQADFDRYFKEHPNSFVQEAIEENREMQAIKEKAIADGTFMKAPNGKDTNLTERQWLQVRTKNFINWFGDWINNPANASKVIDENGEPLVVYHGSPSHGFTIFSKNSSNRFDRTTQGLDKKFYFTKDKNISKQFALSDEELRALSFTNPEEGDYSDIEISNNELDNRVYPVFLNIRRPVHIDAEGKAIYQLSDNKRKEIDNSEGAIIENTLEQLPPRILELMPEADEYLLHPFTTDYLVSNSNQIKSATDNIGTFSLENDDIQMFIGKKARTQFEQQLRKARPDMSDEEIQSTLDFLHSLEDNKENTAYIKTAIRWVANRSITLPQDNTKARQAFDLARKKNIDLQKYATLGELIASDEMKPKEKEKKAFNPDEAKTFSNKRTVTTEGGRTFTVYDVENTEEGQREVCKALAAHYKMSPWCLSTFTATGEPTESAKHYWGVYSALPRKIAFENGKPVAFSSLDPASTYTKKNLRGVRGVDKDKDNIYYIITRNEAPGLIITSLLNEGLIKEVPLKGMEGQLRRRYNLTEKGIEEYNNSQQKTKEEAWWDIEDKYPQDTLSDSIISEEILDKQSEEAAIEAERAAARAEEERQQRIQREEEVLDAYLEPVTDRIVEDINSNINVESFFRDASTINYTEEEKNNIVRRAARQIAILNLRGYANSPEYIEALEYYMAIPELEYEFHTSEARSAIIEEINGLDYSRQARLLELRDEMGYLSDVERETVASYYDADYEAFQEEQERQLEYFNSLSPEQQEQYRREFYDLPFFKTPQGEIYGFVGVDKNIYLDINKISPEHPIHEYTHLWDRALWARNPELWKKGVQLLKSDKLVIPGHSKSLWQEIEDSDNYGKSWKKKGIKGNQLESLIASEVHARLVGKEGAKLLDDIAKQSKSTANIIQQLKQWILDAWKSLKATFSDWSQEEIDKLTLEDFNNMVVRDFADGVNLKRSQAPSTASALKETKKPESPAFESDFKQEDSRTKRFYNTFTPQQIKDRGAMIADMFSNSIDNFIDDELVRLNNILVDADASDTEKEEARQLIDAYKEPVRGRQLAVQNPEHGYMIIKDEIKDLLKIDMEEAEENGDENKRVLLSNTIEFFDELFYNQASLDIEEQEGMRLVGNSVVESADNEENEEDSNGNDETGNTASGNDGWNFKVRYENPFNTLSKRVKKIMYNIERNDKDDLGNTRKYPMGQIYASLLSYLSKEMQSPDDFLQIDKSFTGKDKWGNVITEENYPEGYPIFPVLEKMRTKYMWVEQLIDRLTMDYMSPELNNRLDFPPTYGAVSSQLYTNFRKAFIPYGKIQLGEGNFGVTPMNYDMEERSQLDRLKANYNNGFAMTPLSIYNSDTSINREHAAELSKKIDDIFSKGQLAEFSFQVEDYASNFESYREEDRERMKKEFNDFIDSLQDILMSYGIGTKQDTDIVIGMLAPNGGEELKSMLSELKVISDEIAKLSDKEAKGYNYIINNVDSLGRNRWDKFFQGRGFISDASYVQSFYDSVTKKTKYSYSADNYLQKTFRNLYNLDDAERKAYMDEHFKKYEWFYNHTTNSWRNKWLEKLYNGTSKALRRDLPYRNIDTISEIKKKNSYTRNYIKWTPSDIWQVQTRSLDTNSEYFGYYLAPIFSDSPMSMTVRGPKLDDETLMKGFIDLVDQELWRIKYVTGERAQAIKEGRVKPIANFDTGRGAKFCFMPELNDYVLPDGRKFIDVIIEMTNNTASKEDIEALERTVIDNVLENRYAEYYYENTYEDRKSFEDFRNSYRNMVYANASIIQLTTIDLAYYKDDTDFQKRFKEVYAGGIQLNTNSRYGKKTENTVLIADDIITSPSFDKIAATIDSSNTLSTKDKEYIKNLYKDINVGDAQAMRSMESFRSVLDMMGNWDDRKQKALDNFEKGEWTIEDFDVVYQTIKPFVYAVIDRNDGMGGTIAVPQQHKNSEICMLMMYDLITKHTGFDNSPVYKALSRFMQTRGADGEALVDMIQFESGGKVGNQGVVNISFNPSKVMMIMRNGITVGDKDFEFAGDNTEAKSTDNYKQIRKKLTKALSDKEISQKDFDETMDYLRPTEEEIISMLEKTVFVRNDNGVFEINPEYVHTIPFDNYYQQQPTPEHHIDAEASFGSQARNIIVADLPDDFEITLKGKKGNKPFKGKNAVVDFYYELLNENLLEDFYGKGKDKGLKGIFSSKESFRDAVRDIVRGNPKYGSDFIDALQIEDGKFVLSPNSPTMFNLMQDLITSMFKNHITKQKINGAALIQAAGIGLDDSLRLVYDENGKLKGAECYMPLTSKKLFEPLLKTDSQTGEKYLDVDVLHKAGLDEAIGYRIPTENKSSMLPLIMKGFTPMQNGSAIVLPAEITTIAGSDFDVDKMYVMLSSFKVINYDMKRARKHFEYEKEVELSKEWQRLVDSGDVFYLDLVGDELEATAQEFNDWFDANKEDYELDEPIIKKIEYDFSKTPKENGRKARNNMIIQLMYGILTSKEGSESVLNPQGFPDVEKAAKISQILDDSNLYNIAFSNISVFGNVMPKREKVEDYIIEDAKKKGSVDIELLRDNLKSMSDRDVYEEYSVIAPNVTVNDALIKTFIDSSTDDLQSLIKTYSNAESPVYPQTFSHAHAKNMAGTIQIGIYAVQASMSAKFQRANIRIKPRFTFKLNDRDIDNVDYSDNGKRLKNVGQMVGASADNGKNPNLTAMGSTSTTAPIIGYMLRLGLNHTEASLIINQPFMKASGYDVKKFLSTAHPDFKVKGNVTTEMLVKNIVSPELLTEAESKAIDVMCYNILYQNKAIEYITQVSRADSPNGAMGNTFAKARLQKYKVDLMQGQMAQRDFPFNMNGAVQNNAAGTFLNIKNAEDILREKFKTLPTAFLQGMYTLGIDSLNDLASPYFFMLGGLFDHDVLEPILYNIPEGRSDATKEKLIASIYNDYITYVLSGSALFGNEDTASMESKRQYYLSKFADDYTEILRKNPDIKDLIGPILTRDGNRIVLNNVGVLGKNEKNDISRRLTSLAYGINAKNPNQDAIELAKHLLLFSYYDSGLNFRHDSYASRLSPQFLIMSKAYTEALDRINTPLSDAEIKNFQMQYFITHKNAALSLDKDDLFKKECVSIEDGKIIIDRNAKGEKNFVNASLSQKPLSDGINVYKYIEYGGSIYVLDEELYNKDGSHAIYSRIPNYDTSEARPFYSSQMSVNQLADIKPITVSTSSTSSSSTDSSVLDDPSTESGRNDGSFTSYEENTDDAAESNFNEVMGILDDVASGNTGLEGDDPMDMLNEGNNTLDAQLC